MAKRLNWNESKNELLKAQRKISFEEIALQIHAGLVLEIISHPNKVKFPNQKIFVVELRDYVWLVPFVESETEIFLKTIIPSRKAKRQYGKGTEDET